MSIRPKSTPENATLLEVLVTAFDRNELLNGYYSRLLPFDDELRASSKFAELVDEARRWKGAPLQALDTGTRRLAAWPDLELRQSGRGVLLLVPGRNEPHWWNDPSTWKGDPMADVYAWTFDAPAASGDPAI
jgi:hypothetical protein